MSGRVFVVGSSNTDMVIKSVKLPAPGETVLGGSFLMNAGGKGANQAVAAAKLGAEVVFVAKIGNDVFGLQSLEDFKKIGINTAFVHMDPDYPSGVALILVDDHGENCISVASGANANLQILEVEAAIDTMRKDDILLIQFETPILIVEHAIQKCKEKGSMVILNPAPFQKIREEILSLVDVITPNETEAEMLTGVSIKDAKSAEQAAKVLYHKGIQNVIITMGSMGAYLYNKNASLLIKSPTVDAIDSTGAGDVFNGALASCLAENQDFISSITYACRAASISVTRLGAQSSSPLKREL